MGLTFSQETFMFRGPDEKTLLYILYYNIFHNKKATF